jgi:DNA-directed RNA polymerase specialized sigma24 family protein
MESQGSVSIWIKALKQGDQKGAQRLWDAYFERLVALARARLRGAPRRVADEEDVALSAFDSFCRGVERGRFPQLDDRDNLWHLLWKITVRKACDLVGHERRGSRGGGKVRALSDLTDWEADAILGREPTPELVGEVTDECRRLLERLGDATLRSVALWKMEGFTNEEIAGKLGCVRQTVDRKLRAIRQIWGGERGT